MTDVAPNNDVISLAEKYRRDLAANDAKAMTRLINAYKDSYDRLADKVELLARDVQSGNYTASQVHRLERYKSLMAQIGEQLRDLQALTKQEIDLANKYGIEIAGDHARGLIAAVAGDERLAVAFNKLNPEVVKSLSAFTDPEGPLMEYWRQNYAKTYQMIADDLTNAIIQGWNPVRIAETFRKGWGMSLTAAMRMTRTTQLYAYRDATKANYIANNDVVEGWQWFTHLDDKACAACIGMHGTYFPADENGNMPICDDHYNGRCVMIPVVKGFGKNIEEGAGEEWFKKQPDSTQEKILGTQKLQAWKDGGFEFKDLSKTAKDPVFGDMRAEKTLKELVGKKPSNILDFTNATSGDAMRSQFNDLVGKLEPSTELKLPGMTEKEMFYEIKSGNSKYYFTNDTKDQAFSTMINLERKRRNYNPEFYDDFYGKEERFIFTKQAYSLDKRASATGGWGEVIQWNGNYLDKTILDHEVAHTFAQSKFGSYYPPQDSEFWKIAQIEKPPTTYARVNIGEDFAESVALFINETERLMNTAPKRFDYLDNLLRMTRKYAE